MPEHDWNDLKFLLALHRSGSLSKAARATGVNETTVARRIRTLEQNLGTTLIQRGASGRYALTDEGEAILPRAERIEAGHIDLAESLGQISQSVAGTVRISSVPFLINHILIPSFGALRAAHPKIQIELTSEERNVDLTKREADLAVRFARPSTGGLKVKAQKLGELAFGAYCAAKASEPLDLDWITYDETHASLPQAAWAEALRSQKKGHASALRVADLTAALEAVRGGAGISVLPRSVADRDDRLQRLALDIGFPEMARSVWLLSHAEKNERRAITAVKAWLTDLSWA